MVSLVLTFLLFFPCSVFSQNTHIQIHGKGASFPAAVYSDLMFFYKFVDSTVDISYESTGSTKGRALMLSGKVDFAGTDIPFSESERFIASESIVMFPSLIAGIGFGYSTVGGTLPVGLSIPRGALMRVFGHTGGINADPVVTSIVKSESGSELKLKLKSNSNLDSNWKLQSPRQQNIDVRSARKMEEDRAVDDLEAKINVINDSSNNNNNNNNSNRFTGRAAGPVYWDDPEIVSANPEVSLPHERIVAVLRTVKSGTTANVKTTFVRMAEADGTTFDGDTSSKPTWNIDQKSVVFVDGGNADTIAMAETIPYSISFALASDIEKSELSILGIINNSGNRVVPSDDTVESAISLGVVDEFNALDAVDSDPSGDTWPFTTATYLLMNRITRDLEGSCAIPSNLVRFFVWMQTNQHAISTAKSLGSTLPFLLRRRILQMLELGVICGSSLASDGTGHISIAGGSFSTVAMIRLKNTYEIADSKHPFLYSPVGSGTATRLLISGNGELSFVEATIDEDTINEHGLIQLPFAAGALTIVVNLPELEGYAPLVLTMDAVAGIFDGSITSWRDKTILITNRAVLNVIPDEKINVIVRSDSSGTTAAFTSSVVGHDASFSPGSSKLPNWPESFTNRASGNSGIAKKVLETPHSISYMSYGSALDKEVPIANLINLSGETVSPGPESITAVASEFFDGSNKEAFLSARGRINLSNSASRGAWPLLAPIYAVFRAEFSDNAAAAKATKIDQCAPLRWAMAFLAWSISDSSARETIEDGLFVPAPTLAIPTMLEHIAKVKCNGAYVLGPGTSTMFVSMGNGASGDADGEETDGSVDSSSSSSSNSDSYSHASSSEGVTITTSAPTVDLPCPIANGVVCGGNGKGECVPSGSSVTCSCEAGWEGPGCTVEADSNVWSMGVIGGMSASIIAGFALLAFLIVKLKRNKVPVWMIEREDILLESMIARGGYGLVFLGSWKATKVAVKVTPLDVGASNSEAHFDLEDILIPTDPINTDNNEMERAQIASGVASKLFSSAKTGRKGLSEVGTTSVAFKDGGSSSSISNNFNSSRKGNGNGTSGLPPGMVRNTSSQRLVDSTEPRTSGSISGHLTNTIAVIRSGALTSRISTRRNPARRRRRKKHNHLSGVGSSTLNEVNVLSKLRHPNVTFMIAACVSDGYLFMVLEFLEGGSLYSALRNSMLDLSISVRMRIMVDTCRGLHFLHNQSPSVMHMDLKPANILLDKHLGAKISDFGLSSAKPSIAHAGTMAYAAPEVLRGEQYTPASDVYSMGCIFWEISQHKAKSVWEGIEPEVIRRNVLSGLRPEVTDEMIKFAGSRFMTLTQHCLRENPSDRPAIEHILSELEIVENEAERLENERAKDGRMRLLHLDLPGSMREEILSGAAVTPVPYEQVTMCFTDIVGFTKFSSTRKAEEVSAMLSKLHDGFYDKIVHQLGLFHLETIGDAYISASNFPRPIESHASLAVRAALMMVRAADKLNVQIRAGIHTGPVVATVVGKGSPKLTLLGDSVNTAARMEQISLPGKVTISSATYEIIKSDPGFKFTEGKMEAIKGKGNVKTYVVLAYTGDMYAGLPRRVSSTASSMALTPLLPSTSLSGIPEVQPSEAMLNRTSSSAAIANIVAHSHRGSSNSANFAGSNFSYNNSNNNNNNNNNNENNISSSPAPPSRNQNFDNTTISPPDDTTMSNRLLNSNSYANIDGNFLPGTVPVDEKTATEDDNSMYTNTMNSSKSRTKVKRKKVKAVLT